MSRNGTATTLLVSLALLIRALMPDGFMPDVGKSDRLAFVLCSVGTGLSASRAEILLSGDQKAALEFLAGQSQPAPPDAADVCDFVVLHWSALVAEGAIVATLGLEPCEAAPIRSAQVTAHRVFREGNPRAPPRA